LEEVIICIWLFIGIIILLFVSIRLNSNFFFLIMKELNFVLLMFMYSYDQNHWFLMILIVIDELFISLFRKVVLVDFIDSSMINIVGIMVHVISIVWCSFRDLLVNLFVMMVSVDIVIFDKINVMFIIIVSCSISIVSSEIDCLDWNDVFQVIINKIYLFGNFKFVAFFCHINIYLLLSFR
jgi:hypothetical protein